MGRGRSRARTAEQGRSGLQAHQVRRTASPDDDGLGRPYLRRVERFEAGRLAQMARKKTGEPSEWLTMADAMASVRRAGLHPEAVADLLWGALADGTLM